MKRKVKIIGLIIGIAMLTVACGSSSDDETSTINENNETVLTMWNNYTFTTGEQNSPIADVIAEKTGVRMSIQSGDAQKFKVLMAGGDLPDIIYSSLNDNGIDWATIIDSNQLLPLDDLINEHSTVIKENFTDTLDYSRRFFSTDGSLYYLPVQTYNADPENPVTLTAGTNVGFFTRYDLYREVVDTPPEDPMEYLDILKEIQDQNSTTESGQRVYALSGFSNWGLWMYTIPYQLGSGITTWSYGMMYDSINKEPMPAYYNDNFWDGLEFWNTAYNMGILDPEIFTQTYDNYLDKLKNGQTLTGYADWMYSEANSAYVNAGHDDWGLELAPNGFNVLYKGIAADEPYGSPLFPLAVTTNCAAPEKAIDFLDYTYSEEGSRLLFSGIEGEDWENVDGKLAMTQTYYDESTADPNYLGNRGFFYRRFAGYSPNQILEDGYPVDLTTTDEEKVKLLNPIDDVFMEDSGYDVDYPGQIAVEKVNEGEYIAVVDADLTPSLVQAPSDETKTTVSQVEEYLKVAIADVIMAKPEDFEAEKERVINEMNAKGYEAAMEEMMELWAVAQEEAIEFQSE